MNVKAAWSRTIQVRPYESERLELSVAGDYAVAGEKDGVVTGAGRGTAKDAALALAQTLSEDLAKLGDSLIAERLKVHQPAKPSANANAGEPEW